MSNISNTAHLIVTIIESEDGKQPILQYSCSGVNDLQLQESRKVFEYINQELEKLFSHSHDKVSEENYLK